MFFVYIITNLINNKIYIGKCNNIKKRWNAHKTAAKRKAVNDFSYLHQSMLKYGFENFKIEPIEQFESEKAALSAEMYYIKLYNTRDDSVGYNLTDGGDGSSGYKHTGESKKIMSECKKTSYLGENNPFYGKTHTKETKEKQKADKIGKYDGEKNPFYGKKHSEESREKISKHCFRRTWFLSEKDVEEIKYKRHTLGLNYKEIAEGYKVGWDTIAKACRGEYFISRAKSKPTPEESAS